MKRLVVATHQHDITSYIAFARENQVGLEIQVYGYDPNLLDGGWRELLAQQKEALRGFEGPLSVHGAFYDMSSASVDNRVTALTRERYLLNLHIAAELGARYVVFHANYLHVIRHPGYMQDWTRRQIAFWRNLAHTAQELDVTIVLENMWEPTPEIIGRVLDEVNSPHLRACLDVGHVFLYSMDSVPFSQWLERLGDQLYYLHINNNRGVIDDHLPLDIEDGIVDYDIVLPMLERLPHTPLICLEIEDLEYLERSLRYLRERIEL